MGFVSKPINPILSKYIEKTSDCPSNPSDLICLSNRECNRCLRSSGTHEGCSAYSSNPVCDIDSMVAGIDDSGVRKLAACVACKKTSTFVPNFACYTQR